MRYLENSDNCGICPWYTKMGGTILCPRKSCDDHFAREVQKHTLAISRINDLAERLQSGKGDGSDVVTHVTQSIVVMMNVLEARCVKVPSPEQLDFVRKMMSRFHTRVAKSNEMALTDLIAEYGESKYYGQRFKRGIGWL